MSSSNVLGWVFPGPGEDTPPPTSEVNFGPIHYKDSIILQFTPTSYTGEIRLYCDYQDSAQGNVWTLDNTGSPLTYHFNQTTPNAQDVNDYHACHFFFASNSVSTSSGNTLAFQYLNNATGKSVVWSASGSAAATTTTTSSTSTSTSSTSTSSTPSTSSTSTTNTQTTLTTSTTSSTTSATSGVAAAGSTSAPDLQPVSQQQGLSGGAIAGLVIGILALIAIIAGLGFFFGRRARRNKSQGPEPLPPTTSEIKPTQMYEAPSNHQHTPNWAGKQQHPQQQSAQQLRMGELHGQEVSELDTRVVHELGDGQRTELPG